MDGQCRDQDVAADEDMIMSLVASEADRCADIALEICGDYPASYNLQRTGAWVSAAHAIEMKIRKAVS